MPAPPPWQCVEQIEAQGLPIASRRAGDGPPLVLLQGNPLDSRAWRRQCAGLSDAFTVVAWGMPGCGTSDDPPEHFRIRDDERCLAGFIAARGIARPHVLGLSFGSGLALALFRSPPAGTQSLILASADAGWAGSLPPEVVEQRQQGIPVGTAYTFVWCHESLRLRNAGPGLKWRQRTPAMAAGLTDHRWTMDELLRYQVPPAPWVAPPRPKRRGRPPKAPPVEAAAIRKAQACFASPGVRRAAACAEPRPRLRVRWGSALVSLRGTVSTHV